MYLSGLSSVAKPPFVIIRMKYTDKEFVWLDLIFAIYTFFGQNKCSDGYTGRVNMANNYNIQFFSFILDQFGIS